MIKIEIKIKIFKTQIANCTKARLCSFTGGSCAESIKAEKKGLMFYFHPVVNLDISISK